MLLLSVVPTLGMGLPVPSASEEVREASPSISIESDSTEFLTEIVSMLVWEASEGIESVDLTEFLTRILRMLGGVASPGLNRTLRS